MEEKKYTIEYLYSLIKPVFEEWANESVYITGFWDTGRTAIEHEMQGEYWDFQRKSAWEQFTTMLDSRLAGKKLEEERKYSSKEIHQFVAEYAKEANDEGFDMLVGDFADWIEFRGTKREEYIEINPVTLSGEFELKLEPGAVDILREMTNPDNKEEVRPVLPEKLAIHSSKNMGNLDDVLDILLEMQDAINTTVDYLKDKNI